VAVVGPKINLGWKGLTVNTNYNGRLFGNVLHANRSILNSVVRPVFSYDSHPESRKL